MTRDGISVWIVILFIPSSLSNKVYESTEDIDPPPYTPNITTLHPINNSKDNSSILNRAQPTQPDNQNTKTNFTTATWNIETTYIESKLDKKEKESNSSKEATSVIDHVNTSGGFKPSVHLGSIEEEIFTITTTAAPPLQLIKKPSSPFLSSAKNRFQPNSEITKDLYWNQKKFPYKIESPIFTRAKEEWRPTLESKPTEEVPTKIPAGGLYKLPAAFQDKPSFSLQNEEYGVEDTGDLRYNIVKKRMHPWKQVVQLASALVPLGLLVSVLTPTLITVRPSPSNPHSSSSPPRWFQRRADSPDAAGAPAPTAISERCRRRLLCELRAEYHYLYSATEDAVWCRRLRCENPIAVSSALRYLLHRPTHKTHAQELI